MRLHYAHCTPGYYMFPCQFSLNNEALRSTTPYYSLSGPHLHAHPAGFFRDCERAGVTSGSPSGSPNYYRAEDGNVVETTPYGGVPHLFHV